METKKVELINWITLLKDPRTLKKILALKENAGNKPQRDKRGAFGSGKHLVTFISDDFNEPLELFKEYEK